MKPINISESKYLIMEKLPKRHLSRTAIGRVYVPNERTTISRFS